MDLQQPLPEVIEVREQGRVRVCLRGELDLAGVPAVTERLRDLRGRRETVLLDLDELAFIDARGLPSATRAGGGGAGAGRRLALAAPPEGVCDVCVEP